MKIFLDSSKVSEAKRWLPVIDGATTNPSILLKDGSNIYEFAKVLGDKPVSIEAVGDFVTDARIYHRDIPNSVIKVPLLTPTMRTHSGDNLEVIRQLVWEGIPINCTALFSLAQVILAAKVGARYVSLFAGRIDDEGGNSTSIIRDCMDFLHYEGWRGGKLQSYRPELIVGSIRTVGNVLDAVRAGAHIVTIPPTILEKMLEHKFSRFTVLQFEEDAKKLK